MGSYVDVLEVVTHKNVFKPYRTGLLLAWCVIVRVSGRFELVLLFERKTKFKIMFSAIEIKTVFAIARVIRALSAEIW